MIQPVTKSNTYQLYPVHVGQVKYRTKQQQETINELYKIFILKQNIQYFQ